MSKPKLMTFSSESNSFLALPLSVIRSPLLRSGTAHRSRQCPPCPAWLPRRRPQPPGRLWVGPHSQRPSACLCSGCNLGDRRKCHKHAPPRKDVFLLFPPYVLHHLSR